MMTEPDDEARQKWPVGSVWELEGCVRGPYSVVGYRPASPPVINDLLIAADRSGDEVYLALDTWQRWAKERIDE